MRTYFEGKELNMSDSELKESLASNYNKHKRAITLIERFHREKGITESFWFDVPDEFISWLSGIYGTVSNHTFSQYRRFISNYAKFEGFEIMASRVNALHRKRSLSQNEDQKLNRSPKKNDFLSENQHRKTRRDKSRSLKSQCADHIKGDDVSVFAETLVSCQKSDSSALRYKFGLDAACFIRAGMLTGLRPIEWKDACFHANYTDQISKYSFNSVLEVNNAKRHIESEEEIERRKMQVSIGHRTPEQEFFHEKRLLILERFTENEIDFILGFMHLIASNRDHYNKWYESCRKTFNHALTDIKNKQGYKNIVFNISSARHLFASEVRRSKRYDNYELAALLGHTTTSNQRYYGDIKNHTNRLFDHSLPRPWPEANKVVVQNDDKQLHGGLGMLTYSYCRLD